MSDVVVHHIGSTGGLSKCSVVAHTDTGSTVAAYSDAGCTVKVRDAKEIGTSGDYVIGGLPVGTYYLKAVKGDECAVSGAVTFTDFGVKDITLSYALVVWKNGDGLDAFKSLFAVSGTKGQISIDSASGNILVCGAGDTDYGGAISVSGHDISPAGTYGTLVINARVRSGYGAGGIELRETANGSVVSSYGLPNSGYSDTDLIERNLTVPAAFTGCFIRFYSINGHQFEIESIKFVR